MKGEMQAHPSDAVSQRVQGAGRAGEGAAWDAAFRVESHDGADVPRAAVVEGHEHGDARRAAADGEKRGSVGGDALAAGSAGGAGADGGAPGSASGDAAKGAASVQHADGAPAYDRMPSAESAERAEDAARVLRAVALTLVVAVAFAIAGMDGTTASVLIVLLITAFVVAAFYVRFGIHAVRTMEGRAFVYTKHRRDLGYFRVLRQGGVYQSATFLDERRFEPVFAYQRAFDVLFNMGACAPAPAIDDTPDANEVALGDAGVREGGEAAGASAQPEPPRVSSDTAVSSKVARDSGDAMRGSVRLSGYVADEEHGGERAAMLGCGVRHVLALGGGGFAWPKHAVATLPELTLDVVEIDPAVVEVARRWFFLDEAERLASGRLRVITADGRAYLDELAEQRGGMQPPALYDAIVNDTFSGHEPVRALATVEAARAAHTALAPDGRYLANVVSRADGTDLGFLRDIVATLLDVFAHVQVLPAEDEALGGEDNYLVVASDAPCTLPGAIPFDDDFLGTVLHDV